MQFADRLAHVETSAIRELFKLLGKPGIVSFAGGFPDAALFDVEGVREAAQAALAADPGGALQYGATEGYAPLRASIASLMQGKGAPVESEQPIVTTGSQQALDLIGKTMISPGDAVIVEAPTFLATIQCFRLYGARLVGAPIDADGVDVERLEQLIREHRPKLIYLIPTFGNPSGATLTLERRRRVLELAVAHRVLVVEDDPYGELWFDRAPPPSLLALAADIPGARDWLVHCGSLSKVLSPGLRIGWLVAPPALLGKAVMCKQFSDAHTSTYAQATAQHYLASGRMPAAVERVRAAYGERSRVMCDALERALGGAVSFVRPAGGMFVWARLTAPGADAAAFAQRAIERGVAFVPGAPFFAENPDRAAFRMSYATSDPARIEEGVKRLAAAL
jgi:DNA-binding transcriptional MocR family regulator